MINDEKESSNQNLIALDECTDGEKMPDGATVARGKFLVTSFIKIDEKTYYHNLTRYLSDGTQEYNQKIYMYDSEKKYLKVKNLNENFPNGTILSTSFKDGTEYARIMFNVKNNNPYFGKSENGI